MDISPQIQSVTSSYHVSSKTAMQILKKFLEMQRKYYLESETDILDDGDNEEEYFNLDDQEHHKLGYEEFEQRLSSMIDSLTDDYYLKRKQSNVQDKPSNIDTVDRLIKKRSNVKNEEESEKVMKDGEESYQAKVSKASSTSSNDKEAKRKMKEMKKAKKQEEKEAKRAMKKEAKEAKKAEKEKEIKKWKGKKEKRKREKEEESSTKKHKI